MSIYVLATIIIFPFVFWYLWRDDRKLIQDWLTYLISFVGLGYQRGVVLSAVVVTVAIFLYYGVLMYR